MFLFRPPAAASGYCGRIKSSTLKYFLRVGDELAVARMVDGFHAGDDLHQLRVVVVDVLDELGLGVGRPGDEHGAGVRNRLRDPVEESLVFRGVSAADRIGLVMDVLGRVVRVQHQFGDVGRVEMKHAGLAVVDPHDGVKVVLAHDGCPFLMGSCACGGR